jgi:TolB-like protein
MAYLPSFWLSGKPGLVQEAVMRVARYCGVALLSAATLLPHESFAQSGVESGIDDLARQIVERSQSDGGTTIAISAFPHVDDTCSELSNFLVDELVLSLFSVPNADLQIIERSQLGRIFSELELSMSGAVDANTTQELGRIHGVDTLLVGSLTTIGDDLRVNARLINTETAQVYSAAAVNVPKTSTLEDLMERPSTTGCTMTPSGQSDGASAQSADSTGRELRLTLRSGEFNSVEQLVGVWSGIIVCEDTSHEMWFKANRPMANGVSGAFRGSWEGGWGKGEGYSGTMSASGSATLLFQPSENDEAPQFRFSYKQDRSSGLFNLELVGVDALYGTAVGEDCSDVAFGRERSTGSED